ncbi:hypothetical protein LQW54_002748 [Pestalotiopsis sp. IQ-011]
MSDNSDWSGIDEDLIGPSRDDFDAAVPYIRDVSHCMCYYRTAVKAYKVKAIPEAKHQRVAPPAFQVLGC